MNQPVALNPRVLDVPKSATLAINEISKQLVLEGRDIYRLGLGQSPFPVPARMVQALQTYAAAKDYLAVQGYLPLREAIAGYIQRSEGLDRHADDIIVGPGSKELLFGLQMALDCDLVLPTPSWVSYDPQARLLGKQVHWLACRAEDGWKLNADTLDRHCRKYAGKQQLLILNSPNNPSGACFNETELRDLARVAAEHRVVILSDEIYSELHFQGRHQSIARYYPAGTIISNGISKWAGAGGWRLGFFAFPRELQAVLESMVTIASETFTSVSAPVQMASISAFEESAEMQDYILACRRIMAAVATHFSERLNHHGVHSVMPDGGFYCLGDFARFSDGLRVQDINDASAMCRTMLQETGVAALPGQDFGLGNGLYVRFACVDFDGHRLLQRLLEDPTVEPDQNTPELRRVLIAADRLGDWFENL